MARARSYHHLWSQGLRGLHLTHLSGERRKLFSWKVSMLFPEAGKMGVVKAEAKMCATHGERFLVLQEVAKEILWSLLK